MATLTCGYDAAGNAKTYTTIAAALAASSTGDTIELWYATATQGLRWPDNFNCSNAVSFTNGIGRLLQIKAMSPIWQNTGTIIVQGLAFTSRNTYASQVALAAGSTGTIKYIGCTFQNDFYISNLNGASAIIDSCYIFGSDAIGFRGASGTSAAITWRNCSAIGCGERGFRYGTAYNCHSVGNTGNDFADMAGGDYNCSSDGTAPGANSITKKTVDCGFHSESLGGLFRITNTSDLVGAGTAAQAPTSDFFGRAFAGTPSIGYSEGIYLNDDRATSLVSAGGTFDEAARNTDPGEVNVLLSTSYKIQNVDKVGSYTPTGPTTPTVTASVLGESVTFTIADSNVAATNTIYIMRRNASAWTSSGSRTGDGTIVASLSSDYYWAYCVSSLGAESISTVISLQTTSDSHTITPEEIIRQRLIASGDVAAVVGEKVFPQAAPQSSALPYIIINGINGNHNQHMEAASGILEASVQVDFYAKRLANAKKLANAARLALDGFSGTVSGLKVHWVHLESDADGFDMPDDGSDEYIRRVTHTYSVWVDESVPTF